MHNDNPKSNPSHPPTNAGEPRPPRAAATILASPVGELIGDSEVCCVTDPGTKAPTACASIALGHPWHASPRHEGDYGTLSDVAGLDLSRLVEVDPRWDNVCVRLGDATRLVVLDIEPAASDAIKQLAQSCPEGVYAEKSLSGEGVHVALRKELLEDLCERYPIAAGKIAWKSPDGSYELLISRHNVTFTGNEITGSRDGESVMPLLEGLAAAQRESVSAVAADSIDVESVKGGETIVSIVEREMTGRKYPLERYGFDGSRRDSAVCTMAAGTLDRLHLDLDDAERVSLTKRCAEDWLRENGAMRDKWDEVHSADGRSYGEMTSASAVAYVMSSAGDERRPFWYDPRRQDSDEVGTAAAAISLVARGCDPDVMEEEVLPLLSARNGVELGDDELAAIRRAMPIPQLGAAPLNSTVRQLSDAVRRTGLDGDAAMQAAIAVMSCWEVDGDE